MTLRAKVLLWAVVLSACGEPSPNAGVVSRDPTHDPPATRSAATQTQLGPGLPESRPLPFQVELRRREGQNATLLRVSDQGVRYTVTKGQHDVTLLHPVDAPTLDGLYAALREHRFGELQTEADRNAQADGTSIRMQAGRLRASASRMGQFVPVPDDAADYDASLAALDAIVPRGDEPGHPLTIDFDPSMAERRASLELDLQGVLVGVTVEPQLIVHAAEARTVTLHLRYGPPATTIEQTVDLRTVSRVTIKVDPQVGLPIFALGGTEGDSGSNRGDNGGENGGTKPPSDGQ